MPPQQVTTGPVLMEGIERTNAVVVRGQGQGVGVPLRRDPYAMEVNRGRNCYACGVLGTWPAIAEIGNREKEWQRIEGWSIEEEESRRFRTLRTI